MTATVMDDLDFFNFSEVCGSDRTRNQPFVDLSRNEHAGEIPKEITGMRILNYLNLLRNHLVGSIPSSISTMQSLTSVDFFL
ncbi:hypothetical protein PRUPE_7G012300 [Prunus persica]|uniref:Leucine-rich repeat-containing N-terminal plant-type domain-containing protein n=1 Tax=Prunus persica TaxID=3760 RepID=A0A251N4T0_PRUPE|nr:hypothetical protein PRUPE_7G012300 [Prunus persica]